MKQNMSYPHIRYFTSPSVRMGEATRVGGCGNNIPGGFTNVGIFGSGITAVSDDTFHVSCLNAVNSPLVSSLPPSGTLMYMPTPAWLVACGFPLGSCIAFLA